MTSLAPLALSISSQLIEDYLYLGDPPPPALAERGSLVAIDGGLLAIDGSQVMHFELEPTSEGGWRTTAITVPVPSTAANTNILLIKAFIINGSKDGGTPTSTLNLLCFYASDGWADGDREAAYAVAWLVRETGGDWQNAQLSTEAVGLISQVQSLEVFNAGAGEGIFVYGLTTDILGQQNTQMFVLKIWSYDYITTAPWSIASQQGVPDLPPGRMLFLASGDSGSARQVSLCLTYSGGTTTGLVWSTPLTVQEETGPDISNFQWANEGIIQGRLEEFLPIDGLSEWTAAAVDTAGLVYRITMPSVPGQNWTCTTLNQGVGPTNVTAVSVTKRIGQSVSIFAVGDGRLWLTRDIANVNWVHLGNAVAQLATPGHDTTVFEIYYADPTATQANRIYHLSQDGANAVWKRQILATIKDKTFVPSGTGPTPVGTISIELAASHQNTGAAAHNALINIQSDQFVVLLIDKQSYWIGPGTPNLQIPADQLGAMTIRHQAADLKFPHLTFYATEQDRPNSPTVGCRGDAIDGDTTPSTSTVANRLAGNGDSKNFRMTTANLRVAQLLPGTPDDSKTTDCIRQLGAYMLTSYTQNNSAAATPKSWTFGKTNGTHTADVSKDSDIRSAELGALDDDAGDVLNWLQQTTEDVGDVVVTVAGDVVTVTVGIYHAVVTDARQAGDAIGTILAKAMAGLRELEDVLSDIIKFLKMLFEWGDIVETHNALKILLNWGINFIPANAGAVNTWVDQQLTGLETKIQDAITQAGTYLGQNDITANGYAQTNNLTTPGQSQNLLSGSQYQTHLTNHKSRCTYVLSRARPHVTAVTASAPNGASVSGAMTASFQSSAMTDRQQKFYTSIQALLSSDGLTSVDALFDASAKALLELSKDLITESVAGLEAVVQALLEAIASAATWFANELSEPLDIPVISWLYSSLVEETLFPEHNDLSPLDLFCLILAAPITILYKLIRNDEAPFGGSRIATLTTAFGDPANTNINALSGFGADSTVGAAAVPNLGTAAEVLGIIAGCLDLASGIVGYSVDNIALLNQTVDNPITVPYQPLVAWTSWALSTLSVLCAAPITIFAAMNQGSTDAVGIAKTVLFGLEAVPNLGDFITLAASNTNVMRMYPNSGAYWDGACGFVIYGSAIAYVLLAVLEQEDGPWDYINAVVSNINRPFRVLMPLVTNGDVEALGVVSSVIATTDIAATLGGTATQIGSSFRG